VVVTYYWYICVLGTHIQLLHATRNEDMRISQVQKDIDDISRPILSGLGFDEKGLLGECIRSNEVGKQAILLDCVKDSKSFSISIRVFLRYDNLEGIFDSEETYTVNKLLASESLAIETYSKESLKGILNRLISEEGMDFFSKYETEQSILLNLTDNDYKVWVTSDKVCQFKIRLAAAVLSKNNEALAITKEEAAKYCAKPWSEPDREVIHGLCACV